MRQVLRFVAILGLVGTTAACSDPKPGNATPEAAGSTAALTAPASATPPAAAASSAAPTPPPEPSASAAPAEPPPSASASATPAGSAAAPAASAAAGPKTFDCGAKGQKACPMQGWMKSVMGSATSAGDGPKMAAALSTIASKPIPGMGSWSSIANAGAAKAKAGDIDGAKASCKQCHDLYKEKYKTTMRDRPW